MAQVTITINNREYAVACEDGQEARLLQLARILDEKAKLLTQATGQVNENMLLALVGLLVADELTELKKSKGTQVSSDINATRILEIDENVANQIKTLEQSINSIASKINLL